MRTIRFPSLPPAAAPRPSDARGVALSALLALALTVLAAAPAVAQPGFEKTFQPDTIGPGSVSTLVFTINTLEQGSAEELAFTDALPAGVTIADPSFTATTCAGTVDAPAGGGTIIFSDGAIAADATCEVRVDVTSAAVGTHANVSGELTSTLGNSGVAAADLTVATDRPGFSKSFVDVGGSPISSLPLGSRARLLFTIDNSANASLISSLSFTDVLPSGLRIADPAAATNDCAAPLSAPAGGDTITFGFGGFLAAGALCTVRVDVVATGVGVQVNRSGELTSSPGGPSRSSGFASDDLEVTAGTVDLDKEFADDPVAPGGTVTLRFTLRNLSRTEAATGLAFSDDLDGTLSGLAATDTPLVAPCGAGSLLAGTSLLSFTGGSLPAEGSCSFDVTLQVPAGATPGAYLDVIDDLTGTVGGSPFVGEPANDLLYAVPAPRLEKSYVPSSIAAGDATAIEFTITNTSTTSTLTDVSFSDKLVFEPSGSVTGLPAGGFCGAGSFILLGSEDAVPALIVLGANLAAGDSCTFQVDLLIPDGFPQGSFLNVTSEITGTVDGETYVGDAAEATLDVVAAPSLLKQFIDDPVQPGDQVTLRFTIEHEAEAPFSATDIELSDDLGAVLAGLQAAIGETPAADVCGVGSLLSGMTTLSLTGGTLAPGESCTFDVILDVPVGAPFGTFTNTVTDLQATIDGIVAQGPDAGDDLVITAISFTKAFVGDPVVPGETVDLQFTLQNLSPTEDATGIAFTDDLSAALSGLAVSGPLPPTPCGPGSSIVGTTTLAFSGGELAAGTSCTFAVTLLVPGGAAEGSYNNVTSDLSATVAGSPVTLPPAADALEVAIPLSLTKEFTDDPALPGGTAILEFTLTNADPTDAITDIGFTDDLDAALAGLASISGVQADVCGAGSQLSGTSLLTLTGGSLAGGASCTFSVTLQLPDPVVGSPPFVNTTSTVDGTVNGIGITADPASDTLEVFLVAFTKSFDGPTTATGTATLTFTLTNLDTTAGISSLAFTDDLGAVVPGLVATDTPQADVCGAGSTISGTGFLTMSGGELAAADSCTFSVEVAVPAGTAPGSYANVTSELTAAGLPAASPATASLVVEPPPAFAKVFMPDAVGSGQASTLVFTIDNTASAVAASSLSFTDDLPAGLVVGLPANASTTCTGGTLTSLPGNGTFSYSGGSVAAGASCTVQVDVVAAAPATYVNTSGELTSSSGSSGTATDTLVVEPPPAFSKAFAAATIAVGGTSTLTFTIDNSGSAVLAATALAFTDTLPAGVEVAAVPNVANTCGGVVTATAGSGTIDLTGGTVAAGAVCTVAVDVIATTEGSHVNVSGELTSSSGSSGTASATLEVVGTDLALAKTFLSGPVLPGGEVTLELVVTAASDTTSIAFSDDLDAALPGLAAVDTPQSDVCGAGSALTGTSVLSLTGGSLPAGGSCTLTVTLAVPADAALGTYTNTTSAVTGVVLGSPTAGAPAMDDLTVAFVDFTKSFAGPVEAGGTTTLSFTITNPDPVNAIADLEFTDDLEAVYPGLVAVGLPQSDVCGLGSTLTGSSTIVLAGGNLPGGGSCTFDVTVQVPADAADSGSFVNVTSPLVGTVGGAAVTGGGAAVAEAPLVVAGGSILVIPTLGEWGLLLLVAALVLTAATRLRRSAV